MRRATPTVRSQERRRDATATAAAAAAFGALRLLCFCFFALFCRRSLKPVGTESKSAIIIVVVAVVVARSRLLYLFVHFTRLFAHSSKAKQSRTCVIHVAPCGPDPATIGTDAVSACASSSCDVVVVVVVCESFFSIFFLRCSHTFASLLAGTFVLSLAHSLTCTFAHCYCCYFYCCCSR